MIFAKEKTRYRAKMQTTKKIIHIDPEKYAARKSHCEINVKKKCIAVTLHSCNEKIGWLFYYDKGGVEKAKKVIEIFTEIKDLLIQKTQNK